MKDDYIRKEDAVNIAESYEVKIDGFCLDDYEYGRDQVAHSIASDLEDIESADVALVVHAHWIPQKENHEFKEAWMKCSACGYPVSRWTGNTNFCPNCGAKMDEHEEE